jgi:dTDP-glucose 4,6-dehydratase
MRLLVTGHCGFIGQNFVRMFKDEHFIVGIDKMSYASDKNAFALPNHYHVGDISKECLYDYLPDYDIDAIVNFAAETHVDNSIENPEPFIQSNVVGTFRMLEFARKRKIKRFLQIGTDEVYGFLTSTEKPFSESDRLYPSSPYSASKASSDLFVQAYAKTFGLDVVITRTCNNYGPYQHTEKFIPTIITMALRGESIPVYGSGKNVREWLFVDDNCKAIMEVLKSGKSGEVYNIGSGIEKSNIELVQMILVLMGKSSNLIKYVEDRAGHDFRYALNFKKVLRLGWKPTTSFKFGLQKTIEHYKEMINVK